MIVLINTFKNMVVKFVGGCSVATRSYMIIHSVSKIYSFACVCGKTISTNYSNFDSKSISITANSLLSNVKDKKLKKVFGKCKVIHALKQPKNLLRLLSKSKVQNCISKKYGLYRYECKDSRCSLCASYIQECSSFITSNGYNWKIRCHINCHSRNALYFLSCNSCNGFTTCTGKTVNFRHRMNNHITACQNDLYYRNFTLPKKS